MGNDSLTAYTKWMDGASNHVYSLFDIWEAGCDFQREKDAKEIEKNSGEEAKACAWLIRRNK